MCWVYMLKEKPQDFETFHNFHVWIQTEARSHIGTLHIGNEGKYTSNDF